jgi:hypothetical protein
MAQAIEEKDRKSKATRRAAAIGPSCADHLIVLRVNTEVGLHGTVSQCAAGLLGRFDFSWNIAFA